MMLRAKSKEIKEIKERLELYWGWKVLLSRAHEIPIETISGCFGRRPKFHSSKCITAARHLISYVEGGGLIKNYIEAVQSERELQPA